MRRRTISAMLLCFLVTLPALAQQDFVTTDDAWVDFARPDEAIGAPGHANAASLRILSESQPAPFRSYMKFTVTGAGVIGRAELVLYSTNGSVCGFEIHRANNNTWTEGAITWNNQPGFNPAVISSTTATPNGTEFRLDVSSVVTGDGTYSFVAIIPTVPTGDPVDAGTFESKDAGGANPPTLHLVAPGGKTIVYILAGTSAYDTNVRNALGSAGITADGVDIPGLGYEILPYAAGSEPVPASAVGDLIFISQSVSSGNVLYHTDETVPVICTESGLYADDAPPRSEMFFSEGEGERTAAPFTNLFRITNNSHPITSIFQLGDLETWHLTGNTRIGWMVPPMAPGVTTLAVDTVDPNNPVLAIADAGADLLPGGQGTYDPAPARRIVLGYQGLSMDDPTSNGIFLLQRCVQWAMGDPVTAGGPSVTPPTVPLNLTARPSDAAVELTWDLVADAEGYRIYQSLTAGGPYTEVTTTTLFQHIVPGLTNGTPYYFVVTAFNAAGESDVSNEVSATPQEGISLGVWDWRRYR